MRARAACESGGIVAALACCGKRQIMPSTCWRNLARVERVLERLLARWLSAGLSSDAFFACQFTQLPERVMTGVDPGSSATNGDRLNGWKEIAAYFGKGVRTVQRWERELGLPVHRIKGSAGEILFASVKEIDRWQREREEAARGEQAPLLATSFERQPEAVAPVDTRTAGDAGTEGPDSAQASAAGLWNTHRARVIAGVALFVCVAGALAWIGFPRETPKKTPQPPAVGSGPTSWRVSGGRLEALDAENHLLWFYDEFPAPLNDEDYREPPRGLLSGAAADIDADGRREVLLAAWDSSGHGALYCFNAGGNIRFRREPGRDVRFGAKTFNPPFKAVGFQLTKEADGRRSIWLVGNHHYDFPAVVQKRDASGELLAEYWSNGHIVLLAEATMGDRRVILVGATNNESGTNNVPDGASLAVIDYNHPSGCSPAATKKYTCTDSPAALPLRFFLFPRTDVCHALAHPPYANQAVVGAGVAEIITVQCAGTVGSSGLITAHLGYRFDEDFNLVGAEAEETYRAAHSQLRILPEIDHPFGPRDEREIAAVREWKDGRFVPVKIGRAGTQGTQ